MAEGQVVQLLLRRWVPAEQRVQLPDNLSQLAQPVQGIQVPLPPAEKVPLTQATHLPETRPVPAGQSVQTPVVELH